MYDAEEVLTRQLLGLLCDPVEKYKRETDLLVAEEFGLTNAKSYFMVAINDKSFLEMNTSEMADLLREELGKEKIIVLLNNEILI